MYVAKSNIRHPQAGMGLFAGRRFRKGETIGSFYGTLVYHDLQERSQKTKTYGNGILEASVDKFIANHFLLRTSGDEFRYGDKDHTRRKTSTIVHKNIDAVYIVPAPFCAAGYVNDPRYGTRDEEQQQATNGSITKRVANLQSKTSERVYDRVKLLTRNTAVTFEATQGISAGEELYVDYGRKYHIA